MAFCEIVTIMGNSLKLFSQDVTVVNELGIHARSAAKIAELAKNAKSKVWVQKGDEKVDGKSVIDILTLAAEKGSTIRIAIEDASEMDTLNRIIKLVSDGFGE
jgi:phosphocarrier protein HPr